MTPTRRARDGATSHTGDSNGPPSPALLALYPGIRQTGWAVLAINGRHNTVIPAIAASGTAGLKTQQRVEPAERIAHLLETLSGITCRWRPGIVVCSNAGGLTSLALGREELDEAIRRWADSLGLPVANYAAPEVRATMAGKPNASKDALAHAVMLRLRLIGQSRSPAEWEAIAAGCHHLALKAGERALPSPPVDNKSDVFLG